MYSPEIVEIVLGTILATPRDPNWRAGQYLMNSLRIVRPDLHLRLVGTPADPFYRNDQINNFWLAVFERW